jgi:HK97 family phage major capsid protein/HK97 family phage prohead protease
MQRAYSLLDIKSIDDDLGVIEGIATTPSTDRMGDIVESAGAEFLLPLPLLWQHDNHQPIGHVTAAKVTKAGIAIKATIARGVSPRIDEAWSLIRAGLVRGLSIGFKALETAQIEGTFGIRFIKWSWLELSAVTIPANQDASVTVIRSLDAEHLPALGDEPALPVNTPGATGTRVVTVKTVTRGAPMTVSDQIKGFEATRQAKAAELDAIQNKAAGEGRTKDASERESFDTLKTEIANIDAELKDLRDLDVMHKASAQPVAGDTVKAASDARGGSVITVRDVPLPPGIGLARAAKVRVVAALDNRYVLDVAKEMYPSHAALHGHFTKGAVPGGTTTETTWASPLVYADNLASEFVEYLRPMTILGKLALRRIPFNVRYPTQISDGTGYWVGQGQPKPLTSFGFSSGSLGIAKVAAISVITEELARLSSPSAEALVRDSLAAVIQERLDIDFIDPAQAAVANVNPASVTNGLVALSSAGPTADNVRTDLINILSTFAESNVNPGSLALVMPNTLAIALSILTNSLGQPEFPTMTPTGGTLFGIPVVTSQYAANASGAGNLVIAINQSDVFLADDGGVRLDASRETSLQMLDNPTNASSTGAPTTMVSMFQTNSIALRAERFINWAKRRSTAVVYMDDVNWGSVGSP